MSNNLLNYFLQFYKLTGFSVSWDVTSGCSYLRLRGGGKEEYPKWVVTWLAVHAGSWLGAQLANNQSTYTWSLIRLGLLIACLLVPRGSISRARVPRDRKEEM